MCRQLKEHTVLPSLTQNKVKDKKKLERIHLLHKSCACVVLRLLLKKITFCNFFPGNTSNIYVFLKSNIGQRGIIIGRNVCRTHWHTFIVYCVHRSPVSQWVHVMFALLQATKTLSHGHTVMQGSAACGTHMPLSDGMQDLPGSCSFNFLTARPEFCFCIVGVSSLNVQNFLYKMPTCTLVGSSVAQKTWDLLNSMQKVQRIQRLYKYD